MGRRSLLGTFRDSETGFDYANQRYHNPGTGRFLTPDPYQNSAGPTDPGSWNRFAYARGDPVNRFDPTGLDDEDLDDGDDGGDFGGGDGGGGGGGGGGGTDQGTPPDSDCGQGSDGVFTCTVTGAMPTGTDGTLESGSPISGEPPDSFFILPNSQDQYSEYSAPAGTRFLIYIINQTTQGREIHTFTGGTEPKRVLTNPFRLGAVFHCAPSRLLGHGDPILRGPVSLFR